MIFGFNGKNSHRSLTIASEFSSGLKKFMGFLLILLKNY